MKKSSNVYTILIVFLLLTQQIISGCTTTVTKDIQKEELVNEKLAKEELEKETLAKEKLAKEKLAKEKLTKEKLAKEKLTKEKLAKEKLAKEKLAKEKLAKEKLAKEKLTKEKLAKEKLAKEKLAKEMLAKEMLAKEKLAKEKLAKEKLAKEKLAKEMLVKEELYKEEEDLFGQYLYRFICTTCHPLPDTDDYDYTPEEWSEIAESMYDTMEHRKLITLKEIEKIKDHLKKELTKEELKNKDEYLFGHYLYRFICTACHPLPDTDDYDYTPEEWSEIADSMYDTMEHRKLITLKEIEKIKDHLKNKSQQQQ
ncbi:hypothetical protein SCALIN_C01_0102 [Candidatus Scalindua japonica]|uniref:Uncharacterized protein n=1 Tax=Candidatus Scalindua japonica TaxID=1284222 RepID=A0A286TTI2_9BACT|nr:hypothetical protein [Candidatus Scalindua japonica]GAX59171.1 hypothetical protein SCALIN_C01_0102 [Candidatus Scalindua japonica]